MSATSSIVWITPRHNDMVLHIDQQAFGDDAWDSATLTHHLRQRNIIGVVIEAANIICGYMVYELQPKSLHLIRLVIRPDLHRQGYGGDMIQRWIDKLSQQKRYAITVDVPERNLAAQLFFQACGFLATGVEENDDNHVIYRMRYEL